MRSAFHGKTVSKAEAEYIIEQMQHYCQNPDCKHPEIKHDVDGGALDGACNVQNCPCGKYVDLVI